ncbi:MAG: ISKra4 family transposase, partial [Chlamydiota bacterium]
EKTDADAPVRACYRYLKNRLNYLDYKGAEEKSLPIGSGEIESAHRHVLQNRLKLPGAWWTLENAKNMIHLRTCRANHLWDEYWKNS